MQKRKQAKQKLSRRPKPQKAKLKHEPKYSAFGQLKGKTQIVGDIVSPITPHENWEALKD